jgi:hypothetical protein
VGSHRAADDRWQLTRQGRRLRRTTGWQARRARDWTDRGKPAIEGAQLRVTPPQLSISHFLIDKWLAEEV